MVNDVAVNVKLDLTRNRGQQVVYARANDTKVFNLHIVLTNNGRVVDLSQAVACIMYIKKPSGTEYANSMTRNGNELSYTIRTQDVDETGEVKAQVYVGLNDGTKFTSPVFTIQVYSDILSADINNLNIDSVNQYNAITDILAEAQKTVLEAKAHADSALQDVTEVEAIYEQVVVIKTDVEETVANAIETIEAAAASAEASATAAAASATSATASETAAAASETNAAASVVSAQTYAGQAENHKTSAEFAANTASNYANVAETSATSAINAAEAAEAAAASASGFNMYVLDTQAEYDAVPLSDRLANAYLVLEEAEYTQILDVGSGYAYATIKAAENAIASGGKIVIHEGTYDEYGIGAIDKVITYEGVDKNTCIVESGLSDKMYSVFNLSGGNKVVKNLTIHETHSNPQNPTVESVGYKAYALHVDAEACNNHVYKVENCILKNKYFACVGIGGRQDCSIYLSNCEMYKYDLNPVEANRTNGALYEHISTIANTTGQFTSIKNCIIKSKYGVAFRVDWTNTNGRELNIEAIGNTVLSEELGTTDVVVLGGGLTSTSSGNNVTALNYVSGGSGSSDSGSDDTPTAATTLTPYQTTTGALKADNSLISNSRMLYIYEVTAGSTYKVSTSVKNNSFVGYASEIKNYGETLDSVVSVGYVQMDNYEVTIPDGMSYLYVSVYADSYTATVKTS